MDGCDPVIQRELSLVFDQQLLKLLLLGHFGRRPPFELDLDYVSKALVLREFSVECGEISPVALEQVKKSFDASDLLEPSVLLEDGEDSPEHISAVGASSSVAGQSSVLDDHQHCPGVVEHHVKILDWDDGLLDMLERKVDLLRDFLPGLLDILCLIDIEHAGVRSHLLPDLVVQRHLRLFLQVLEGLLEDVEVRGRRAVDQPGNALQSYSHVDDLDGQFLGLSLVVVLVLHEDHVPEFQSVDEVLDAGAEVTSAGPDVLDEGDLAGVDLELLSQPAVVELHALILEEDELAGLVEDLDADHHEAGEVAAREPDVVEIVEPEAELGADERVGRRVHLSGHAVGLEAEDACRHVVHVVPPAGDDGVSVDLGAGHAGSGEGALEGIPSLLVGDLFFEADAAPLADEGVLAAAAE